MESIKPSWREAATAPRDGSHFYAANFDSSDSGFGTFSGAHVSWQGVVHWWGHLGEEGFYLSSGDTGSPIRFTHWRPLLSLADGVVNALKRAAASIAAEQAGRGNMDSSDIPRADDSVTTLTQQRDELLAALKDAQSSVTDERLRELKLWLDRKWNRHQEEEDLEAGNALCELIFIRAAIAKASGSEG